MYIFDFQMWQVCTCRPLWSCCILTLVITVLQRLWNYDIMELRNTICWWWWWFYCTVIKSRLSHTVVDFASLRLFYFADNNIYWSACVVWVSAACSSSSWGPGCVRPLLGIRLLPTVQRMAQVQWCYCGKGVVGRCSEGWRWWLSQH